MNTTTTKRIIIQGFALAALMSFAVFMQSCSKSNASTPTPVEANTKLLSTSPWKISNVQVDGVDKTTAFNGMTIQFTSSGFTTTNGNVVWSSSGTWSFDDATATSFKRDDGVDVTIKTISSTALQLTLSWTKTTLSRTNSISGQYVFNFEH